MGTCNSLLQVGHTWFCLITIPCALIWPRVVILSKQRLMFHAESLGQLSILFTGHYSVVIGVHRNCCIPHRAIFCSSPVPTLPCISFPWTGILQWSPPDPENLLQYFWDCCTVAQHQVTSSLLLSLSRMLTTGIAGMLPWKKKDWVLAFWD